MCKLLHCVQQYIYISANKAVNSGKTKIMKERAIVIKSLKNKFKKVISGVLTAALAVGTFGGSVFTDSTVYAASVQDSWIFREANNADAYSDRISGNTIFLDWNGTPLRGIISKEIYSDYKMTAQIKKGSSSSWTSLQLGIPCDDRLDMWENLNGGALIGGTGLQVAISDTKATVGLVNGVENNNTTQVEVALNGVNTTSDFVNVSVTVKDNIYDISIGSQHIAKITPDKGSIQYGGMELRREWVNGTLVPVYADSDVAYYTSGKITANGNDTYFNNKAIAVVNSETGDGTFGFSTRAEAFWVKDVNVSAINESNDLNGDYFIKNVNSGKYLDISGGSSEDGANVQQWSYNGSEAQKFRLVSDENGYYSILTGASSYSKAIDIASWGTTDGTNVIQWAYHGGDCQKFRIEKNGDYYAIKTKVTDNTKCLDVEGPSIEDGANVHQWSVYGGAGQLWVLESVNGGSNNNDNNGNNDNNNDDNNNNSDNDIVDGGIYYIRNVNSSKYLDVAGISGDDGANIQQWSYTGFYNQQFKLVSDNNGYYSILTAISDFSKAIDVDNWQTNNGTNILQWSYHGGDCQKFKIEKEGDYYAIKTKITDNTKCLDVEGPSIEDGANVHQWDVYGGAGQLWVFESIDGSGSVIPSPNAASVNANLSQVSDPPLLKKVEMYNAGCIEPLNENYARDFARIRELNSTEIRLDASINKWEGTAGKYLVGEPYGSAKNGNTVDMSKLSYDFTRLDPIIDTFTNNGVLPYIAWCYVPDVLCENGEWNNLDTSITNWREVWEEVHYQYAKHYVDKGVQIGYHEIYNEPDLETLLGHNNGFLDLYDYLGGAYLDMYEYGARGILRADSDATIGGPAFADAMNTSTIDNFLARVTSRNLPLDFFSYHSYLDGNTWFMSSAERAAGAKNEQEKVVAALAGNSYFIKTGIHINEYTYLNAGNGGNDGRGSAYNYYGAASDTLDAIMEVVDRTSVTNVYWAQFMESTFFDDPYGLIDKYGRVKAAFNAVKVYNDMPEWRYETNTSSGNIRTVVSSDDDKISVLIWSTNGNGENVNVFLNNADFASGTRRVYRIDQSHASSYDGANPELVAEEIMNVNTSGCVWTGNVPANGVIYITINKDGKADFNSYNERTDFADYIKTQYYYEDRYRGLEGNRAEYSDYAAGKSGSYSYFDSTSNTMFLGMGDSTGVNGQFVGQAHASGAIICKNIPSNFKVKVTTEGNINMNNINTTLGFRVDFYDNATGSYTKSVYFHNGLYNDGRNPNAQDGKLAGLAEYPWGTQRKADQVVQISGDMWNINLYDYAPAGWNTGTKVQISFDMQNTGANTRAQMQLIA